MELLKISKESRSEENSLLPGLLPGLLILSMEIRWMGEDLVWNLMYLSLSIQVAISGRHWAKEAQRR